MASLLWILIIHLVVFNFSHECICLKLKISFNKKSALRFFPVPPAVASCCPPGLPLIENFAVQRALSCQFCLFVLLRFWVGFLLPTHALPSTWHSSCSFFFLFFWSKRWATNIFGSHAYGSQREGKEGRNENRQTKAQTICCVSVVVVVFVAAVVCGIFAFVLMPLRLAPATGEGKRRVGACRTRMRTSWTRCLLSLKSTCNLLPSGCGLRPHRHRPATPATTPPPPPPPSLPQHLRVQRRHRLLLLLHCSDAAAAVQRRKTWHLANGICWHKVQNIPTACLPSTRLPLYPRPGPTDCLPASLPDPLHVRPRSLGSGTIWGLFLFGWHSAQKFVVSAIRCGVGVGVDASAGIGYKLNCNCFAPWVML